MVVVFVVALAVAAVVVFFFGVAGVTVDVFFIVPRILISRQNVPRGRKTGFNQCVTRT